MEKESLSIFQLNRIIKDTLKSALDMSYWVIGEISDININSRGHCYLELVEKDEYSDRIIARARCTIWASRFSMLRPYFETSTGQELTPGIKILVRVSVEFHELYGMSLNIKDIEPSYTLGEIARLKQMILSRLEKEGVLNMNKETELPLLPRRIAVISSTTAAGYEDFRDQLLNNPQGYKYYIKLFPAVMQGEETEKSIIRALDKIFNYEDVFDVVAIIRGGGAKSDLNSFNSYELAYHITQFPLPVITGIGHEQDETIPDIVAHTRMKTPTAVAEFLLERFADIESYLEDLEISLIEQTNRTLRKYNEKLNQICTRYGPAVKSLLMLQDNKLKSLGSEMIHASKKFLSRHLKTLEINAINVKSEIHDYYKSKKYKHRNISLLLIEKSRKTFDIRKHGLEILSEKCYYLDPRNILKRGYSITRKNGKVVLSEKNIEHGDELETVLFEGKVISRAVKNSEQ